MRFSIFSHSIEIPLFYCAFSFTATYDRLYYRFYFVFKLQLFSLYPESLDRLCHICRVENAHLIAICWNANIKRMFTIFEENISSTNHTQTDTELKISNALVHHFHSTKFRGTFSLPFISRKKMCACCFSFFRRLIETQSKLFFEVIGKFRS